MLNHNPITQEVGECIVVGRAATAIYLVLSELKQKNKYVLVPANICYAAVFPIISAGLIPLFCDVDKYSGNITISSVKEALNSDVVAAIIPHMYGNPIQDIKELHSIFLENNVIMIEDCASLMTNEMTSSTPGTVGDYVLYSTGYSKTVDLGFGGILYSKTYSLSNMEQDLSELPLFNDKFEKETSLFSKIYRLLRNQRHESNLSKDFYGCLNNSFKDNFLYRIDKSKQDLILEKVKELDDVISSRRYKYLYYKNKLQDKYDIYFYTDSAVPWRFNILVKNRDDFVKYCLENELPISDWYPCVTPVFGIDKRFDGAAWHEKHIVNFPLMIDDGAIDSICDVLLKYDGEVKIYG